ncbi:MAG: 4-hydroxy-tetrahydrodipicolinate reductase [Candidatus Euphemobacter frigidus]|nr:4-hydroxy-tetrahydrodipicolinate reductase [Candidatus Euphemobacter frigidus]MDP8274876.1 4-hydroxy-tetrahydrodipicolinate reductase [Candidatus Euphemobacter frigidus]
MIKLIICGAAGRMGKRIITCAQSEEDLKVTAAVERVGHPDLGRDAGEISGVGAIQVPLTDSLEGVIRPGDVVIDFSAPGPALVHAGIAAASGKALVIGTTGFTPEEEDQLRETVRGIACVFSPNMSVGVNLLFKLVGKVAETLGDDYDIEIVEAHHRFKKDAPSGTARKIARIVADALDRDLEERVVYGRVGMTGERTREEIGIHSIRAGDIVGDHTVIFSTPGERLELTHRAHSRDTFARGALRAARFAAGSAPGFYSMIDILEV